MKEELPVITLETLGLYRDYTGIDDYDQLETHLISIKKKLVKEGMVHYRCIQRYKFAIPRIYDRFFYKDIIQLAQQLEKNGQKPYFLDVGCCTGTDLRKLLIDGYPKDCLIGMDIESSYIDCGYKLFQDDPATCPIQFLVNDLFTIDKSNNLCNTIEVVHTGSVFHLFSDQQMIRQFLHRITWLLRPGGLLLGGHVCADQSTQYFRQSTNRFKFYIGIDEFKALLNQEGFTAIKIKTDPRLLDQEEEDEGFITFWISFSAVYRPL